jgi:hypothetical protein
VRIFLGSLVAAVALGAAVFLHDHSTHAVALQTGGSVGDYFTKDTATYSYEHRKDGWHDPLAIFVGIAGVGAGAAIIVGRRQATPEIETT